MKRGRGRGRKLQPAILLLRHRQLHSRSTMSLSGRTYVSFQTVSSVQVFLKSSFSLHTKGFLLHNTSKNLTINSPFLLLYHVIEISSFFFYIYGFKMKWIYFDGSNLNIIEFSFLSRIILKMDS